MRDTQNLRVLVSVAGLLLGGVIVLILLNRLIFRRLEHISQVATRVVGGGYWTEIQVGSHDEVGSFEQLFEQFRCIFVDV